MGEVVQLRPKHNLEYLPLAAGAEFIQQPLAMTEAEAYCANDSLDELLQLLRPPESEIYGRSLSTISRLGAFMVNKSLAEAVNSPEADQARVEFYTSVEEGFGTDLELGGGLEVRDFDNRPIIDGKVMAKDLKTAVSSMTEAGLRCAEETARHDEKFSPQLTRSKWDHENALEIDKMASGKTDYNTRIVISPFPEEAAKKCGNEYWRGIGYVPHLKRGFVQLYFASEGNIITGSLSFDGSNKQRLREIFKDHNIDIPEDEITDNWLQYAITGNMTEVEAEVLAIKIADQAEDPKFDKATNTVDVTKEFGQIMDQVFNESYIHVCESLARGYQTEAVARLINQFAYRASSFNERYQTALNKMKFDKLRFTDDDSIVLHELLVYSTIEMMRALHLKNHDSRREILIKNDVLLTINNDPAIFQRIMSGFAADGALKGRVYSACGLSISPGEDNLLDNLQSVFGGVDESRIETRTGEDKYGSLTFKCPKKGCVNTREPGKLIEKCQKCGADVRC